MGTRGFAAFTQRAARASSAADLGECVIDFAGPLVGTLYSGMDSFEHKRVYANLPARLLRRYEALGRPHDPVRAMVARLHAPLAASVRELRAYSIKAGIPAEYLGVLDESVGHHYMVAPVVVDGSLVGTLNFARKEDRAFGARELALASAFGLNVSTRLAALRALERGPHESWRDVITARGLEVADLAARGFTAQEMGRTLGVSPNTVKKHLRVIYERLGVATRAELATLLASARP